MLRQELEKSIKRVSLAVSGPLDDAVARGLEHLDISVMDLTSMADQVNKLLGIAAGVQSLTYLAGKIDAAYPGQIYRGTFHVSMLHIFKGLTPSNTLLATGLGEIAKEASPGATISIFTVDGLLFLWLHRYASDAVMAIIDKRTAVGEDDVFMEKITEWMK